MIRTLLGLGVLTGMLGGTPLIAGPVTNHFMYAMAIIDDKGLLELHLVHVAPNFAVSEPEPGAKPVSKWSYVARVQLGRAQPNTFKAMTANGQNLTTAELTKRLSSPEPVIISYSTMDTEMNQYFPDDMILLRMPQGGIRWLDPMTDGNKPSFQFKLPTTAPLQRGLATITTDKKMVVTERQFKNSQTTEAGELLETEHIVVRRIAATAMKFLGSDGKPADAATTRKFASNTPAFFTSGDGRIDPFYLQFIRKGMPIVVLPDVVHGFTKPIKGENLTPQPVKKVLEPFSGNR